MRAEPDYLKEKIARGFVVPLIIVGIACLLVLVSCGNCEPLDDQFIEEFHKAYFGNSIDDIKTQNVALYVDYSTCVSQAMNDGSAFFNDMVGVLTSSNVKDFYSIMGSTITQEDDDKYSLLKSVKDSNYADIKTAAENIANGNTEGILLTDGEYYQRSIAKGNDNNPWMERAITKWLSRGHEIYVFAEPYKETTKKGKVYDKKRYYFVFTDTRFDGNIYDHIKGVVDTKKHPQVQTYHLTANHFDLYTPGENNSSIPNNNLYCKPSHCNGQYEVQIWDALSWKKIYRYIIGGTDDEGNPLPNGEAIITGLNLDRNSNGSCFRITDVEVRVSNISDEYLSFCDLMNNGQKPKQVAMQNPIKPNYADNFILLDKNEFNKHGNLDLYFDKVNFNPTLLNKECPNLLKIDFIVKSTKNNFTGNTSAEEIFTFPSITKEDAMNTSVVMSIRNALKQPSVKKLLNDKVIYTIYIFSDKNNL